MNNLAASILAAETDKIINRRDSRAYNASRYDRLVPEGFRVKMSADSKPSYWLYSLLLPNREEFQEFFHSRGIETSRIDLDMRDNPVFGEQSDELEGISLFNRQHVAIPVRHNLTNCEVDHIEDTLAQFFSRG